MAGIAYTGAAIRIAGSDQNRCSKCNGAWNLAAFLLAAWYLCKRGSDQHHCQQGGGWEYRSACCGEFQRASCISLFGFLESHACMQPQLVDPIYNYITRTYIGL